VHCQIVREPKRTHTPTYSEKKEDYGSHHEVMADYWFYWNDIEQCVKGTKWKLVIDWPKFLDMWFVVTETSLNQEETRLL